MLDLSRLHELANSSPEEMDGSMSYEVGEIVGSLPALSRKKELRVESSRAIAALPTETVAPALAKLARDKEGLQATDDGLGLEWVNATLSAVTKFSPSVIELMIAQGQLILKALLGMERSHKSQKAQQRMKRSILHHSSVTLRIVSEKFRESASMKDLVEKLLATGLAGLIGLSLMATANHEATKPTFAADLASMQDDILKAWIAEVLNAKPQTFNDFVAPVLSAGALDGFWSTELVSQGVFDETVVPALQKALLRAPEGVVAHIVPSILLHKALNFDKLASSSSLVSNLSSSNVSLRKSNASAFGAIVEQSKNPDLTGLLAQFKKVTNSEQRALFADVLSHAPRSEAVAAALASQAPKESTESGIGAIADALVRLLPDQSSAVDAFKKGLSEARKPLRREWICSLAAAHIDSGVDVNGLFTAELGKTWKEISENINAAASAKLASAGYALIVLGAFFDPVPEALFSSRVYEHLTSERELILSAEAAGKLIVDSSQYCGLPALVHASLNGTFNSRSTALKVLGKVSQLDGMRTEFFEQLRNVLQQLAEKKKDVSRVVSHVQAKEWVLIAFVLTHQPYASPSGGWIQLCLRSGVDPNKLVNENSERLFDQAIAARSVESIATLIFVAPEALAQRLTTFLQDNLRGETMTEQDLAILQCPEGQLVTPKVAEARSRSKKGDSDEAWEEELRKEIAKKHGKLTPEQQVELEEQSKRRNVLKADEDRIHFCCAVLTKLAYDASQGAENGSLIWMPEGQTLCLAVVNGNAPGNKAAASCLASLSVCLSDRFKGHWKMIASKLLLQGKKVDMEAVRDMLYMLNPISDKRLLDAPSLVYILPVLRVVLERYNGETADETADETIMLVTSLLANQAAVLNIIPRGDLVNLILVLLAKFAADRAAIKDCLRRLAQQIDFNANELGVLLDTSISAPQDFVRSAALEVIDAEVDLEDYGFAPEIWIARFGEFGEVAQEIWRESAMRLPIDDVLAILSSFFGAKYSNEREALARAYSSAILATNQVAEGYERLEALYIEKKQPPKPVYNNFGLEVKQKWIDPVPDRLNILEAFTELVPHLSKEEVLKAAEFIVTEGVTDKSPEAATGALELGKRLIDLHGATNVDGLLPIFEDREIILYGFAAQHLPASDPRLTSTVDRLLAALPTASERSLPVIISSLGPLAARIDYHPIVKRTLDEAYTAETTESRRGAAFGFAGLANGIGLSVLGDLAMVNSVSSAVEDRKDAGRREGAQLIVGALAQVFGRKFEPYALELMPQVLIGLGDVNQMVREAANEAARRIMGNTTSFGIKRQIPLAIDQLDQTAWRGKKGAVELLGSMAYLSPQQLATSLATIVPEIVSLLNDTHKEVRAAAKSSMKMFGDVIENPEIHKLVPTLLGAISDPTSKTHSALSDLLKTRFMHYIDSPSLALIIFVVQRGLRDRSAATKRMACQIVGNMSILTAGRDLVPYLPTIMPDLQAAMTDPVPQTSSVACKALGVLVEKLGEDYFPSVIPDLLRALQSDERSAVGNRWGTAQGLSEVLHGLGTAKLEEVLPEIVANCQSPKAHIRQGFIPLLLLLPGSFGASLTPYLPQLIPPLLRGLADQLDDIRENSLKAGRRIVRGYATIAVDLLLPELEQGLWDRNWRIRLASVELVGDLLMQLLGKGPDNSNADRMKALAEAPANEDGSVPREVDADADAKEAAASSEGDAVTSGYVEASLRGLEVLGTERRDRVIGAIFICRADVVPTVRQAALDTWLALIQNTPRAVKLILPTLVTMLIRRLSDDDDELQTNAARALAELVRRVSGALSLILPTFIQHLPDRDTRQGICLGLVELIPATSLQVLQEHEAELMQLVRTSLQDSSTVVREAATRALEELHAALGDVAGDMLPEMVEKVVEENDEGALAALKEMLTSTDSGSVLAATLPALLNASTLDEFKASAVADICAAAGPGETHRYAETIVDKLIDTPFTDALDSVLRVSCPESHLLTIAKSDERLRARVFARIATYYGEVAKADMLFVGDWVVFAFHGLEEERAAEASVQLLFAITNSGAISKPELAKLSTPAYNTLTLLSSPIKAFATSPKGPAFVLPFFLQGLALGSNLEKEQSALALAEVVKRTEPVEMLKPVVTQITGPLIRIVGERTPADVKAAIIYTLNELLTAIPTFLKPFLPQLQRTFAKNLADQSSSAVRTRSSMALGTLIKLQTRIDPLAKEIISGVRTASDSGVRTAFLSAVHEIVCNAGVHLSEGVRDSVAELIADSEDILGNEGDQKQLALFARIGADLVALAEENDNPRKLVDSLIHGPSKLQSLLNANALLMQAPDAAASSSADIESLFEECATSANSRLSENGVSGLGKILLLSDKKTEGLKAYEEDAVSTLVRIVPKDESRSAETRRLAVIILGALIHHRESASVLTPYLDELVPPLFASARDTQIPIKLAAEKTFSRAFDFVGRRDSVLFDEWFARAKESLDTRLQRSLPEYVRRVALRAAAREAEAEDTNEEADKDELSEIWAVGLE